MDHPPTARRHRATKVGHLDAHDGEIGDIEVDEDRGKDVASKAAAQPHIADGYLYMVPEYSDTGDGLHGYPLGMDSISPSRY